MVNIVSIAPHLLGSVSLMFMSPKTEPQLFLFIMYSTFLLPMLLKWNNPVFTYLKYSTHNVIVKFLLVLFIIYNYYAIRKTQLNV